MAVSEPLRWRHDASTSRAVRALWALGVGSFLAAILLIMLSRVYIHAVEHGLLRGESRGDLVLISIAIAVAALAILAICWPVVVDPERTGRVSGLLGVADASAIDVQRRVDAAAGTVVMAGIVLGAARGVGGSVGHGVAAGVLSFGLVALVTSSVLDSAGRLDPETRTLRLDDPEQHVDLDAVSAVRVRRLGDVALLTLAYDPTGTYAGRMTPPQRLVLPVEAAEGVAMVVEGDVGRNDDPEPVSLNRRLIEIGGGGSFVAAATYLVYELVRVLSAPTETWIGTPGGGIAVILVAVVLCAAAAAVFSSLTAVHWVHFLLGGVGVYLLWWLFLGVTAGPFDALSYAPRGALYLFGFLLGLGLVEWGENRGYLASRTRF